MMAHARDPVVPPSQHPSRRARRTSSRWCSAAWPRSPAIASHVKALGEALAACASAADWGPNRADAWWAAEMETIPLDAPPRPAARPAVCVPCLQ